MSWIEAVFSLGAALKELRREGWVRRGVAGPESVADHSYGLALLSMLVAAERGLDPFRASAIAVIHDLAEVITGDLPPDEKNRGGDYILVEKEAVRRIAESLPERACSLVQRLYEEYASQSSEEARLVKQLDKLEMALQSIRYEREGRGSKGLAREFTKSALEEIIDPDLRGLL